MKSAIIFTAYYLYSLAVILATGYIVFWKDHSGWWFLLAALFLNNSPTITTKTDPQDPKE
jgi:hypothetical protein